MVVGIGNDIIEVSRIKSGIEKLGDKFLNRIFTETEIEYSIKKKSKYLHLAGRFAAKEAVVKALASCCDKGFNWKDIEIYNDPAGRPHVRLFGKFSDFVSGRFEVLVSISHTESYASAVALLQTLKRESAKESR